jgi:hypothetical protein
MASDSNFSGCSYAAQDGGHYLEIYGSGIGLNINGITEPEAVCAVNGTTAYGCGYALDDYGRWIEIYGSGNGIYMYGAAGGSGVITISVDYKLPIYIKWLNLLYSPGHICPLVIHGTV